VKAGLLLNLGGQHRGRKRRVQRARLLDQRHKRHGDTSRGQRTGARATTRTARTLLITRRRGAAHHHHNHEQRHHERQREQRDGRLTARHRTTTLVASCPGSGTATAGQPVTTAATGRRQMLTARSEKRTPWDNLNTSLGRGRRHGHNNSGQPRARLGSTTAATC